MSKIFKYILEFQGQTDKLKQDISGVNGMLKGVVGYAAAAFSVGAVVEFGRQTVIAYNNSIQSETALFTALKGRRDVQEALIDQASELMGVTLFDDDEIVRAQSLVAAFVKEESQIKRLMPAIMDFASAKQMDLASATDMVTRTMNGEMEALGRTGIKIHGAAGSAERLTSIINGLNEAYGGQAEAAAKVGTGALIILENEFGNLEEAIGGVIVNSKIFTDSIGFLRDATKGATNYFNDISILRQNATLDPKNGDPSLWWAWISPWGSEEDWQREVEKFKAKREEALQLQASAKAAFESFKDFNNAKLSIPSLYEEAEPAKAYADSIEGLTERLKDYNEELKKISPNDNAALTIKLKQINAIEKQIEKIDKLKAALSMSVDPMRGQKLTQILPTWVGNDSVGSGVSSGQEKEKDPYSNFYGAKIAPKLDVSVFTSNAKRLAEANEYIQDGLDKTREKVFAVRDAFQQGFAEIGKSVIKGLGLAESGFEGFVGGLATTVIELISMFLAQSLAASIAGATTSGASTGPAAIFTTPAFIATAIGGVLAAFATIPKFADGGIAYGPTLGLMGEYPGASTNPEVIAPLSKLKEMIGGSDGEPAILKPSLELGYGGLRVRLEQERRNTRKRT